MARLRPALVTTFVALVLLLPIASSQVGTFGTQVRVGDSDYVPLLKTSSSLPLTVYRANTGEDHSAYDDCLIVTTGQPEPAPLRFLRLTSCFGKAPGTQVAPGDPEDRRSGEFVLQPVARIATRFLDLNENTKYDTAEPGYAVFYPGIDPLPTKGLPGTTNAGATGVEGAWTLRLTPVFGLAAGELVERHDEDLELGEAGALAQAFSIAEREDKGWYLIPYAATKAAKDIPLPVKSIRIGLAGTTALQPLIQVSSFDLPETPPVAGGSFKFTVRYSNDGGTAGPGLLVTRLNGAIVDARLTPWLNPSQGASQLISVEVPSDEAMRLDVNGFKVTLQVDGVAAEDSSAEAARIVALEARIVALESALAAQDAAEPNVASRASVQGAPGPVPAAVLAVLAIGAILLRRRVA